MSSHQGRDRTGQMKKIKEKHICWELSHEIDKLRKRDGYLQTKWSKTKNRQCASQNMCVEDAFWKGTSHKRRINSCTACVHISFYFHLKTSTSLRIPHIVVPWCTLHPIETTLASDCHIDVTNMYMHNIHQCKTQQVSVSTNMHNISAKNKREWQVDPFTDTTWLIECHAIQRILFSSMARAQIIRETNKRWMTSPQTYTPRLVLFCLWNIPCT